MSEYQRVMLWRLIIEEFWPNIQHISGFENIVPDALSILTYMSVNKYKPNTSKYQYHTKLFTIVWGKKNKDFSF